MRIGVLGCACKVCAGLCVLKGKDGALQDCVTEEQSCGRQ